MTKTIFLIFSLTGALFLGGCSHYLAVKEPAKTASPQGRKVENSRSRMDRARANLDSAMAAWNAGDSSGADFYFSAGLNLLDTLLLKSPNDSSARALRNRIDEKYQMFQADESFAEEDSLGVSQVVSDLNQISENDSAAANDTATVTIPDVIESNHRLKIPLVLNRKVENAIRYFLDTRRGRRVMTHWLKRAGKYEKLVKTILAEEGVPEELFYLAMIESGLNPRARSYARAVGMWQFISATGRAYGLRHSWWFDERRDPAKSTRAAARHLKHLYARFGDWYLALAGYNFNPKKIEYRMNRYDVQSYWDLPRLPRQTRNYIPTFIAAATIAEKKEVYGFDVPSTEPLRTDTVTVRECVDLNVVARIVGASFSKIKELNPALLRWCTPPDVSKWVLNIPFGTRDKFVRNYAKVPENQKRSWVHHRIRPGETLSTIASRYRVSMREIKRFNKIRGTIIRAGHYLVIPVPQNRQYYRRYARAHQKRYAKKSKPVANVPGRQKRRYKVKRGDTLWDIASKFSVTVSQIRRWNGLGRTRIIHPGQALNIWLKPGQPGETDALAANLNLIEPPVSGPSAGPDGNAGIVYHTVRPGDTLWDIAAQYGVSIREIKKLNGKRSNLLHPGDKLKIKLK